MGPDSVCVFAQTKLLSKQTCFQVFVVTGMTLLCMEGVSFEMLLLLDASCAKGQTQLQ